MRENEIEVLSPTGLEVFEKTTLAARLDNLDGKTICENWNGGFKGEETFSITRELLKKKYPNLKVVPYTEFPITPYSGSPTFQSEISKQILALAKQKGCQALISGNGG